VKPPRKILVIATREIGDVLLVTPLIRSLSRGYDGAVIDVLAFRGKAGMLEGNPDIREVLEVGEGPSWQEFAGLLKRLWRSYDLAVTVQSGDRPMLYTWAAAPRRIGIVSSLRVGEIWKRWMLDRWVLLDNVETHTVIQNLDLAKALGIDRHSALVPPRSDLSMDKLKALLGFDPGNQRFVVLHPYPRWRYKQWTIEGWRAVAEFAQERGQRVVLTGGRSERETSGCQALADMLGFPMINLAGCLSLADLTALYEHASAYVGPDTATTHLAAATGVPTIAIYGPSNPMKWGPWPVGGNLNDGLRSIYVNRASMQRSGNVFLIQPGNDCVPCYLEGCERHRDSHADCLDGLPADVVLATLGPVLDGQINSDLGSDTPTQSWR
jgi:heptosyltransferase-3